MAWISCRSALTTSLLNSLLRLCVKPFSYQRGGGVVLFSFAAPYLLLVSFYSGTINDFGSDKIGAINNSPYNGVAVSLVRDGDVKDYKEADFEQAVARIRRDCRKQVWPWVYLDRMIGYTKANAKGPAPDTLAAAPAIRGMDLDDKAGAENAFYENVRLALGVAKKLGSPGIMIDLEAYHDYQDYHLDYLASQRDESKTEVVRELKATGANLADIAAQEYPTATIWFTFTGLGNELQSFPSEEYRSVTYIVQGLLQRIRIRNYSVTIISGGMLSLGYCYISLTDMAATIRQRHNAFHQSMKEYPALQLAGTIALWKDARQRRAGYFTRNKCGGSPVQNVEQFGPYLEQLFRSYKYVWIYAASDVGYNPYDPFWAGDYNRTIQGSLNKVR